MRVQNKMNAVVGGISLGQYKLVTLLRSYYHDTGKYTSAPAPPKHYKQTYSVCMSTIMTPVRMTVPYV